MAESLAGVTRVRPAAGQWLLARPGLLALGGLSATGWLLIALAAVGAFQFWPAALPFFIVAIGCGLLAWWRTAGRDRLVIAGIVAAGLILYGAPSEDIPMFGDAAIYPNAGGFIARAGGFSSVYEPLAPLGLVERTLFYVPAATQIPKLPLRSYQGLVYGAYYLTDLAGPTLQASRPPLVETWFAFLIKLLGVRAAFYATAAFAILGLIALYLCGREAFGRPAALWGVLLLGLSYPQIHFGRAPYAEIFGQFWALTGFYFAVVWLKSARPASMLATLFCWVTAWGARFDAIYLLIPAGLLLLTAALNRDRRSLTAVGLALPALCGLALLGTNGAYVGATFEIVLHGQPGMAPVGLALTVGLLTGLCLCWLSGRTILPLARRAASIVFAAMFAAAAFAIAWSTLPNPWRSADVNRSFQEIIWFSSRYLSPAFYWLALAGLGWVLWRRSGRPGLFLALCAFVLAALYFWHYTSAPVYPVSLRRLIGDLLPLLALLGGAALAAPWWSRMPRLVPVLAGCGVAVWMLALSFPVITQHEAAGSLAFVEDFHQKLPSNAALIFEPQDADSWVGWLAAPLYSLYGDWAVLLRSDTPDPTLLAQAVREFQARGRAAYVVSQRNPFPEPLLPTGLRAVAVQETHWRSSLIGQTRLPYPPPFWEFDFPVYVYRLEN